MPYCYIDAGMGAKDSFKDYLQDVIEGAPLRDMIVVAGNWNTWTSLVGMATWHTLVKFAPYFR